MAASYIPAVLRVVLADDNFLIREGVSALLADVDDLEVVAAVGHPAALLAAVDTHLPDAVLTDIRMPPTFDTEGLQAAQRIRRAHPDVGVVVLSSFLEEEWCLQLVADGAAGIGYLLKDNIYDVDELAHALRTVARGGSALDPRVVDGLLRRDRTRSSALGRLTDRERQVLQQMAMGRSNGAIGHRLSLSERSVEKHITGIFDKLGLTDEGAVNRRVSAVVAYLRDRGVDGHAAPSPHQ